MQYISLGFSRVTVSMSRFTSGSITLKEGLKTTVETAQAPLYLLNVLIDDFLYFSFLFGKHANLPFTKSHA
jgi:hypothetical protein